MDVSAAVGAFLIGLTLTGEAAERTRTVLSPLRDLFAAAFFLAIGFAVSPADLLPVLPTAMALAAAGIATKFATGWLAARRDGAGSRGRTRAGTILVPRGEFSIVIVSLAGAASATLGPIVTAYVLILATIGPVLTRWPRSRTPRTTVERQHKHVADEDPPPLPPAPRA
ncbi:cation:proton antiporter [Amycolatopsis sp. TRM77291]